MGEYPIGFNEAKEEDAVVGAAFSILKADMR